MTQAIIRKGFETKLKTWADAQTPAIAIAWENVPFTPTAARYIRAFLIPARTEADTLAQTDRHFGGFFQASLVMPPNTGAGGAETLLASLDAAFGVMFTQDTLQIWLLSPMSAAPPIIEADRFVVPVSAEYRAHTV